MESCENKLICGIREPADELEGGSASPKAKHQPSPLQAPPEAFPPKGALAQTKDVDPCSWHGSEASTDLPESSVSEATTPRERAPNILNTEVATYCGPDHDETT